jgi:hypothetical protein
VKQDLIALNGTYRLKAEVLATSVQADGSPISSPDVTVVRIVAPAGRKLRWFFDAKGNAYRSRDFEKRTEIIEVEL